MQPFGSNFAYRMNSLWASKAPCQEFASLGIALIMVFSCAPVGLAGQFTLAEVRGTVQDRTGSPLSEVVIVARNVESGQIRGTKSNEEGAFEIPALSPGAYEFQASRPGFQDQNHADVVLQEGQLAAVNFSLVVSSLQQERGGPDGAQQSAQPSQAQSGSRISENQLLGLPLNGRSYSQLATLQSQITDPFGSSAARGTGSGSLTVAGGRFISNNFLLDGTNIMDSDNRVPRSAAGVQLGSDAIFQVQVLSTQSGVEYGRGSGGVLNTITRSGTPQWHGTIFEYFRNSALDARNFFDPGPEPVPFKRNQFGTTVTGPLAKERTFLMGSFEGLRDRLSETEVDYFPDKLARQGIITDDKGQVIQTVTVHPKVKPYLDFYPFPNTLPSIGRGVGENRAPQFLPSNENYFTLRVDHQISGQNSLFGRYTFDDATTRAATTSLFGTQAESRQQYLTLVASHVFSPRVLGSFRFGYTRPVSTEGVTSSIEIPRERYFVLDAPTPGLATLPPSTPLGPPGGFPLGKIMNSFQYEFDVIAQRARHSVKAGLQIHRYRWDVFSSFHKAAIWSFSGLEGFLRAGADKATNLSVALPGSDNRRAYRQTLVGLYLQDQYQVSSRFQLSLGLRYEFATLIKDREGNTAALLDTVRDSELRIGPVLGQNPSLRSFSPRLGFSWSPWGGQNTVVSGGFGIYYDQLLEYVFEQQKNTSPFYRVVIRNTFDSSTTFPAAVAAAQGQPLLARTFDYQNTATPTVLRYNLTLQRLFRNWRLQVGYVGARGNHLIRSYEANLFPVPETRADGSLFFPPNAGPVNPAFGGIGFIGTDAQSFYNSLQLSAGTGFGRDISVQANYTYSRSIDDVSLHTFGGVGQFGLVRTMDRALSDFDLRHRLVISSFYALPFGTGRQWWNSGPLAHLFGGWRLGSIFSVRTGTPFSPQINVRTANYLFSPSRPNLIPGYSNNPTKGTSAGCSGVTAGQELGGRDMYFDMCAYEVPEPGTPGNAGRNTIISPKVFNLDISLQRDFRIDARRRLQFRAEFFNLPNRTNLDPRNGPPPVVFTGTTGRRNPVAARASGTATTARQIQFALRISF